MASALIAPALTAIYRAYESETPSFRFDDIAIVGEPRFGDRVRIAVRQLQRADHHGYLLVRRYLKSIVATEKPIGLGYVIGARFEPLSSEGYIELDTARFAACLVRYAVYRRLLTGYNICSWRNRCARNVALKRELRSMRLLDCNQADVERQIQFIERE
jgi:hypothetical protein